MKKNISVFLLLLSLCLFSQNKTEEKIWNLLLNNQRNEARNLFDKQLSKTRTTNFEHLYLDAVISMEEGMFFFDDTFVKNFVKISPDEAYVYPLLSYPFMLTDKAFGIDLFTPVKLDVLSSNEKYSSELSVGMLKAYYDVLRGNNENSKKILEKIQPIIHWQYCGVFENLNGSGMDIEYEPETYANNDKLFTTNTHGLVGWYNQKHFQNLGGFHFYSNELEYGSGIMYAQTFIDNPVEQEVNLLVSTECEYKIFLNDCEIYSTLNKGNYEYGGVSLKVKLSQGVNRLVIKSELQDKTTIIARITDEHDRPVTGLHFYDQYTEYKKSSIEELNVEEQEFKFVTFLKQKIKEQPSSIVNKLLLLNGYLNNKQNTQAHDLLVELENKYPKSSLLRVLKMKYNTNISEDQLANEILKNIQMDDPKYYLSYVSKIKDSNWMSTASINELEEMSRNLANTKAEVFKFVIDMVIDARKQDLAGMLDKSNKILDTSYQNSSILLEFINVFDYIKNPDDNAVLRLEKALEQMDNFDIVNELLNRYSIENKDEKYKELLLSFIDKYPQLNVYRMKYVELLNKEQKFEEALEQSFESLANFPYSYTVLSNIGYLYMNVNDKQKSIEYINKSLSHNSTNISLYNFLKDINNEDDEIDQVAKKDLYKLIKERRNTQWVGEKGTTRLLDEYIVNVFPEGGYKTRATLIYEITSEQGIEELKEYYLGYAVNIVKSEIVKPDETIIPADKNSGTLVFPKLEIGDVVLIQYEKIERTSGRFYKDFNEVSYFNSVYPVVESTFTVITPEKTTYQTYINHSNVQAKTKKINKKIYTSWTLTNLKPLDNNEYFSRPFSDSQISVRVSTIKTWGDIVNWYADLVNKVMVYDKKTELAFNQIFPSGISSLSPSERAEKIYNYIQKNIKYSYVDFRQSGHIPQKPSRTIQTKLGDCKDLSTLFVILARQAGLEADLVLVLTNDHAANALSLPSANFNHCIARVTIEGKDLFLELTDNYLPFKAGSLHNYKAKALVIKQDKNTHDQAKLIELDFKNNLQSKTKIEAYVEVNPDNKKIKLIQSYYGASKSYYNRLFSETYSEKERKESIQEIIGRILNKTIAVKSMEVVKGKDLTADPLQIEIEIQISEKPKKIGSMNLLSVPFLSQAYNKQVIITENRTSDIYYVNYESENEYEEEIHLKLPEGSTFVEIPSAKKYQYGNRTYELTYDVISPAHLKVTKKVKTSWEDVSVQQYPEFKKFVEEVLEAEDDIIGYK